VSKLRVAVFGILQEAMASCPFPSDATNISVLRGQAILDGKPLLVRGAFARLAEEDDIELVPLVYAKPWPAGPVALDWYKAFLKECLDGLAASGPFDALLIANHSAMEVADLGQHGDSHFYKSVRDFVGPDIPIVTPLDMHGQMTPDFINSITAFSVFRTAPHRDDYETGYRAGNILMDILRGRLKKPTKAYVRLPIFSCGEKTMTTFSPMKEIFGSLPDYDKRPGIVAADIFIGFGWNDLPWVGMQAVVTTDNDPGLAAATAKEIAQKLWDAREGYVVHMETAADIDEGLERAMFAPESPVYVSDSGDNTSAGAGGDLTFVLQKAIANPKITDAIVTGIYEPKIVAQAMAAGPGAEIEIELGADHVSRAPQVVKVTGKVVAAADKFDVAIGSGFSGGGDAWCSIQFDGVLATFHVDRVGVSTPGHLSAMGIDPTAHKVYVFKFGYLMPELEDVAGRHICLITEGNADLDANRLPYKNIPRPAWPMDKETTFDADKGLYVAIA